MAFSRKDRIRAERRAMSVRSRLKSTKTNKSAIAKTVGLELAKKAKTLGVEAVVFDRGRYLYHGRVKALAEGLREGGLKV